MSENERSHVEGRPHLWRLFGVVLCRFCEKRLAKAQDATEAGS